MATKTERVQYIFSAAEGNTRQIFESVRGQMNGLGNQLISVRGLVGTLAAALGAGAFGAGVKAAAEAADAAAKMGDRFGIATEKLIGMQHAGNLAGASQQGLEAAMRSLSKSATDAARGAQEYAKSYELLGINADKFIKLPVDQQLSTIIGKLREVDNATVRNAIGQELLGKGYGEIAGLVAEGADAFEKATRDAEAWGLAVNRVDAAKLEAANDAMTRAQSAAKGLFTTIAVQVAPFVKAIGDYFADGTAEANGFKKEIGRVSEMIIEGIGYAGNVVQGLRLAFAAVRYAVAEVLDSLAVGVQWLMEQLAALPKWAEHLPGPLGRAAASVREFGATGVREMGLFREATQENAARIKGELESIALEGLPREKIVAKLQEIRQLMQVEAEAIARERSKFLAGSGDVNLEKDKGGGEKKDTWRDKLAQKIERLREENMTELELLNEKLLEKNQLMQDALDAGLISEEMAHAQSALTLKSYEEAKTKIIDEETKRRYGISNVYRQLDLQSAGAFFGSMAVLMQSNSKTAFQIGKAAAISQTVIDTYRAAQGAFASLAGIPFVGPILGAAAAAAAIVAGMARVQSIRSQQFGGGSVAAPVYSASPSTGLPTAPISPLQDQNGPPAAPQSQAREPRRDINITFHGSGRYTQEEIRESLYPALKEAFEDGVA